MKLISKDNLREKKTFTFLVHNNMERLAQSASKGRNDKNNFVCSDKKRNGMRDAHTTFQKVKGIIKFLFPKSKNNSGKGRREGKNY